jgi:hypothetical protein
MDLCVEKCMSGRSNIGGICAQKQELANMIRRILKVTPEQEEDFKIFIHHRINDLKRNLQQSRGHKTNLLREQFFTKMEFETPNEDPRMTAAHAIDIREEFYKKCMSFFNKKINGKLQLLLMICYS